MSALDIVKSLMRRVMKQTVTQAVGNADVKVLQALELVNEAGQELAARYSWQALTTESTFVTVATESQGLITTIAGADFSRIVNETFWNRSQMRPVYGPKSAAEWQQLKAQFMQGPWIQYRIRGNALLFLPVPAAGQSVYFEWITKNWCTDATGATGRSAFTVDTDIAKLDERLLTLDGLWRFKKANNLDYGEDQDKAETAITDAITRDGSKPRLNLGGAQTDVFPGILVPAGNWTL